MQYRGRGGQFGRWYGGPSNSFKREGSINIDPGRRNPWWRGGGRCLHFHFHFHLRSWKVKVNVLSHKLSVLLGLYCQCLTRPCGESTRKINVQNFKSLYKQLRPGAKIIIPMIAMIVIVFPFHMIRTPLSFTLEHSVLVFKEQEVSTKTSDGLQGDSNDESNF